jgi:site-specific DNA-methyltransferase (adenine-specific)
MAGLPDASVDMILCDLPYGTTACKWDSVIPFEPLWAQYRRVAKRNAAIVLTASQPFTSALVMSNPREFRYDWTWAKNIPTGFANANRMPMRSHESVLVFYRAQPTYNKQLMRTKADRPIGRMNGIRRRPPKADTVYRDIPSTGQIVTKEFVAPRSVIEIDSVPRRAGGLHPTQKPVALMEYLIRTYTNDGEVVLDNCMGSGTTGVACANTGRRFIGIERDDKYFAIASERIAAAQPRLVA